VLAHDCSFPDEVDVSNHPTPTQLGEALSGTDVGRVYLTHLYPHTRGKHSEMLRSVRKGFEGDVRMAKDGLRVDI
jgi:ribonuclease BN (tRNA processing enzyme)